MLGGSHDKDAPITLCIFPNQREFVAVDTRSNRLESIHLLTVDQMADDEFASAAERSFSALIRAPGVGFNDLLGIPQQIELAMRVHALRRVLKLMGVDEELDDVEGASVGVLFFSGPMLAVSGTRLGIMLRELFDGKLSDDDLSLLRAKLDEMIGAEREAEKAISRRNIEGLIRGDDDAFVTIWRQSEDG